MMKSSTATSVEQQPTSIDFVLTEDVIHNANKVAILRKCEDPLAKESANAILEALNRELKPARYIGQKRDGVWYFTEVPLPAIYH